MWDVVKTWLVPGSLPFLVLALGVGALLLRRPAARRAGRALVVGVVALYVALSLPFTAQRLALGLQGSYEPLDPATTVAHPLAVVVFDGDYPEGRVREAARLYRHLGADWLIVSGADKEMYNALVADGVPPDRIVRETRSSNTREQAVSLGPILRARSIEHFVFVASSIHMRRALAAVRATGLRPIASVSEVLYYGRASGLAQLAPGWNALWLSEESLYEYGALALYWVRGWLAPQTAATSATAGDPPGTGNSATLLVASIAQRSGFCSPLPPPAGPVVFVGTGPALADAVHDAHAGTTILVADGRYSGVSLIFRTPNVTLRSRSGNRDAVVIDGRYAVGEIVSIVAPHVTIADLTLTRAQFHPVHVAGGGDYATLYNLHIVDGGEQFVKENPDAAAHYNDYGMVACSALEITPAGRTYVETQTAALTGYACYTGGIDAHAARGWTVRDNTISDIYCDSGLAEHAVHFWNGSRDTIVERNVLINNARGVGFGLGATLPATVRIYPDDPLHGTGLSPTVVGHIGGVIRNNFIYADTRRFDTAIGLEQAWNASVLHNTIYAPAGGLGIDVRFANSNAIVMNNLATPGVGLRSGGSVREGGGNLPATAAMFLNAAAGDLHLVPGAAAIGRGINLKGLVPVDIDGESRHSPPDVGADERARGGYLESARGSGLPPLRRSNWVGVTPPAGAQ
jgi:uncharacterized SAM-binding protein YcdF (DUF218 family)